MKGRSVTAGEAEVRPWFPLSDCRSEREEERGRSPVMEGRSASAVEAAVQPWRSLCVPGGEAGTGEWLSVMGGRDPSLRREGEVLRVGSVDQPSAGLLALPLGTQLTSGAAMWRARKEHGGHCNAVLTMSGIRPGKGKRRSNYAPALLPCDHLISTLPQA